MNKQLTIILVSVAVIGLIAAGIFFTQKASLQSELTKTEKALNESEKALIYYKSTDLAKEAELLNLKLKNAERDLAVSQKETAATQARVKSLESNLAKIPAYLSVIDAIQDLVADGPTAAKLSVVDAKVSALSDQQMSSRWNTSGRPSIDLERRSWGSGIYEMVKALTVKVRELIK